MFLVELEELVLDKLRHGQLASCFSTFVCLSVCLSVCLFVCMSEGQVHWLMTLLFARTDLYLENPSICTSRICMRINYLSVCLSVCVFVVIIVLTYG